MVPHEIRNLVFEGVELVGDEIIDFDTMKDTLLKEIERDGSDHPYYEVRENIMSAQTIEELTDIMDSVPH